MRATLLLLTFISFIAICFAAQCSTENFDSFSCPVVLPDGSSVFDGAATVSSSPAGKLRVVSPATNEACTFSFGSCSTSTPVDTTHNILACDQNSRCSIIFTFESPQTAFTIGKAWSATAFPYLVVRFVSASGDVVLSDLVSRNGVPCTQGSAYTWSPSKPFTQVEIEGQLTGITELSACNNDDCVPFLFTGGTTAPTPMDDGVCYPCVSPLGKTFYSVAKCSNKLSADGQCKCTTYQFSAPNCDVFFLSSQTPVLSESFLQSAYPVENSVCSIAVAPRGVEERSVRDEL